MKLRRMGFAAGAAVIARAMSTGSANARSEPDYLQQEACEAMDGGLNFSYTVLTLMAAHSGLEEADGGWAAIHGVSNYCPWHKKEIPAKLQDYVG